MSRGRRPFAMCNNFLPFAVDLSVCLCAYPYSRSAVYNKVISLSSAVSHISDPFDRGRLGFGLIFAQVQVGHYSNCVCRKVADRLRCATDD
jgi:hypothetical protein